MISYIISPVIRLSKIEKTLYCIILSVYYLFVC